MKKSLLLALTLVAMFLAIPCVCNVVEASTETKVQDKDALERAIQSASEGDIIILEKDIEVSGHIDVSGKNITINGDGHSIYGNEEWYNSKQGGDQAIITSLNNSKLTLKNITLKHGPKQGAQAYGTGTLVLEGVTIEDCKYSALIAHGGTIVIKDVKLNTPYGIEVALKEDETAGEGQTFSVPTIQMEGTIEKTSEGPIVYADPDTTPDKLEIENAENSQDKMYINGSSVVVTDNNNNVKYEGTSLGETIKVDVKVGETKAANVFVVTINYNGKTKTISVKEGEKLPDLTDVKNAVKGKKFVKFVKDDGTDFNEAEKISENLKLVAVYADEKVPTKNEKDSTPKTGGIDDISLLALIVGTVSLAGLVTVKRYCK